jgi:parallel beta-helix repeat protein
VDVVWDASSAAESTVLETWEGTAAPNVWTAVSAGSTIDESGNYELTGDLSCGSQTPCVDIDADDVTFRGNDKTISGSASFGIQASGGSNVVGKDVTVDGYSTGVEFTDVTNGEIDDVAVTNYDGSVVTLDGGSGNDVSSVSGSTSGAFDSLVLSNTDGNTIEDVSLSGNANYGLKLDGASNNDIEDVDLPTASLATVLVNQDSNNNTFTDVDASDSSGFAGGNGLKVSDSTGNTLSDFSATDTGNYGVYLTGSADDTEIDDATFDSNACGVYIENSDDAFVHDSEFKQSSDHYEVASGTNNRFEQNSYSGTEDSTC